MCGNIAYLALSGEEPAEVVANQYEEQFSRGNKGFGIIDIGSKHLVVRRATESAKMMHDLYRSKGPLIVLHHRQPTSTENHLGQTHPLLVKHDELRHDYYVIHNGVITNSFTLHREHEELGYVYRTLTQGGWRGTQAHMYERFNDSESFAIELARYLEGKTKEIGIDGSAAFICVRVNKKSGLAESLIYGRNTRNPLDVKITKQGILIASDIPVSDKVESVTENTMEFLDLKKVFGNHKSDIRKFIQSAPLAFKQFPTYDHSRWNGQDYENNRSRYMLGAGGSTVHKVDEKDPTKAGSPGAEPAAATETETSSLRDGYTQRELAFAKMAERRWGDIADLIEEFMVTTVCEREPDAEDISLFTEELLETILPPDKMEHMEKARAYFNRQEEELAKQQMEAEEKTWAEINGETNEEEDATPINDASVTDVPEREYLNWRLNGS